jgi:hypothetical protein
MKKYKAKTVLNYVERIYVAQVEVTVWCVVWTRQVHAPPLYLQV